MAGAAAFHEIRHGQEAGGPCDGVAFSQSMWLQIAAGNLLATSVMGTYLWRRQPALRPNLETALAGCGCRIDSPGRRLSSRAIAHPVACNLLDPVYCRLRSLGLRDPPPPRLTRRLSPVAPSSEGVQWRRRDPPVVRGA
jgi:hypothetical protein